jgi:RES domain-containing protein
MSDASGWDAAAAVANCEEFAWQGSAWRAHKRKYPATDPGGSLRVSGRYNRGADHFSEREVWPALYLSLAPEVCLGEVLRHISAELLPLLNDYRISQLRLQLAVVVDCRDLRTVGLTLDGLCPDTDFSAAQQLAAVAIARGAEAILVPSATRLGDNLIVFPCNLRPSSTITLVASRDTRLYVPR